MVQSQTNDSPLLIGVGARTSTGLQADSSAIAVHAGISGIIEHPYMIDKAGDPFMVAMDQTLSEHDRLERMFVLAASALEQVIVSIPVAPDQSLNIYLGLPELDMFFTQSMVHTLCQRLETFLLPFCRPVLVAVSEGSASAVLSMQQATNAITSGKIECCIVGGVDCLLDPDFLEAMDDACNIASATNRWGFPPGEGAAMLAVCSRKFSQQQGISPIASIASIGISRESNAIGTDTICTGQGLAKAMNAAVTTAGAQINKQYCDINGERYREDEFSYAILRLPPAFFVNAVDYIAPADCWGHTGAATGALLVLLSLSCYRSEVEEGDWPMIWCGSNNGHRAVMVLQLFSGGV